MIYLKYIIQKKMLETLIWFMICIIFIIITIVKKDLYDSIFAYSTIIGGILFTIIGLMYSDYDNSEYFVAYLLFIIALNLPVIMCIAKKKNNKNNKYINKINKTLENNQKLFNFMGIIAIFIQFIFLIYPENKLINLFYGIFNYGYDPNFSMKNKMIRENTVYNILTIIKTALLPYFFILIYNLRQKPIKAISIYILYYYLDYAKSLYMGRSTLMTILLVLWVFIYIEKIISKKTWIILSIGICFFLIIIIVIIPQIRLHNTFDLNYKNIMSSINNIIQEEANTQKHLKVCEEISKEISYPKMIMATITAPLPFIDIDFPVLAYKFTEKLLGISYGDAGYYIMLPCAFGESIMVLGKYSSWIYILVFSILMCFVYRNLKKIPYLKYWLLYILLEYVKCFRGSIQSFILNIWNTIFASCIFFLILYCLPTKKKDEQKEK